MSTLTPEIKYLPKPKKGKKKRVRCGRTSNQKFADRIQKKREKDWQFKKWMEKKIKEAKSKVSA